MSETTETASGSDRAAARSPEPIEVPLGFAGTIRLRVAPTIAAKLEPASPPMTITTKDGPLPWKGTINNLAEPVTCSLVWHVAPDDGPPYDVKHWFPTSLVPSNAQNRLLDVPFTIEEELESGSRGVRFDIFRLGLYGRGKLGMTVTPTLRGVQPLTLAPAASGVSYDTVFSVSLAEPEGNPWPASPEGRTSAVGTPLEIRVSAGPLFSGLKATLRLWESDEGEGAPAETGETTPAVAEEPGVQTSWTVGENAHVEELQVGTSPIGTEGFQLWYARGIEADAKLELWWEIRLNDKAGTLSNRARPVRRELLCTAPMPTLNAFKLSKATETTVNPDEHFECVAEGAFAGFAAGFSFPMAVRLYLYRPAEPGDPISHAHTEALSQEIPVTVEGDGAFRTHLTLGQTQVSRVRAVRGGMMFAVLSFPQGSALGGRGQPVFMSAARYVPNAVGSTKDDTGFAPSRDGVFATEMDATGVCSDLLSLEGEVVELESDAVITTNWTNDFWANIKKQNVYNEYILASAQEFGVDALILKSLIAQESDYDPRASRPSGAYAGLTQVSKDLAKLVGCTKFGAPKGPDDRFEPANAIRAGAKYLAAVRRSLDQNLGEAFRSLPLDERYHFYAAGYNLGPGTVMNAVNRLKGRPLTWMNLVDIKILDVTQKDRPLSPTSPLGQAIVAAGWNSKLEKMRHYAEDIVARARQ